MTAHVTQYRVEKQGWGPSAAASLPPQATEAGAGTRRGSGTPPRRARVTQGPSVAGVADWLRVCCVLCRDRGAALTGQGRMATVPCVDAPCTHHHQRGRQAI